jgi:hypothetical protein
MERFDRHDLLPFFSGCFGFCCFALSLLDLFFAFAPAAYFFLSFTHGLVLLSMKNARLKPAHYSRDGSICQQDRRPQGFSGRAGMQGDFFLLPSVFGVLISGSQFFCLIYSAR